MNKADYSKIAEVYDQARLHDGPHIRWWVDRMAEAGELGPGKRLIDLGCGTGRFTLLLAARTGCEAVGLDSNEGMLAKAREKDVEDRCAWVVGNVEQLELEPESADCALMSLLMHHISDCVETFRGVLRLLRPGGVFLIRQGTLEEVADDFIHRFYPETLALDRRRTPFRAEIALWLQKAGFAEVTIEPTVRQVYERNEQMLAELRLRVPSALHLISDEAWQAGLARAEEYVRQHPDNQWLRESRMTLFVARRAR
jgi:ubiquinone/menaquinone biosynthesis C-methylase UbiE